MSSHPYQAVAFYFAAHQDDWQLFMNPNAALDLASAGVKVVFVHLTAGDAGRGPDYWQAREQGAVASVRYRLAPLGLVDETWEVRWHEDRPVTVWSSRNAVCYFLRLCDGALDGSGFPSQEQQSLSKLRAGRSSLNAVDGSASYQCWLELLGTIGSILHSEAAEIPSRCVNAHDHDPLRNPDDHSDHYHTGLAVHELPAVGAFRRYHFQGYALKYSSHHMGADDMYWKMGMFAVYDKAVFDGCGYSTFAETPLFPVWCSQPAVHRRDQA